MFRHSSSSICMVYQLISIVYHLMYIHGIYVVYPWIFLAIPTLLKPDFAAGLCCWSHSMRTREWVIKSVYSTRHHGDRARENGNPQKARAQPDCRQPPPLSPAAAVTAAAGAV